jgi:hypothetical protein
MGLADELFVLLVGNHHYALLAPPRDELRTLGSGAPKKFAKTRFGCLQLPTCIRRSFPALRLFFSNRQFKPPD